MRYEKLTVMHCAIVTLGVAGITAAYQHVIGVPDYQAVVVPTTLTAAISGANYLLARYVPFGNKKKDKGKVSRPAPQPTPMKPQH